MRKLFIDDKNPAVVKIRHLLQLHICDLGLLTAQVIGLGNLGCDQIALALYDTDTLFHRLILIIR